MAASQQTAERKRRRYLTQKTLGRGAFGTVYLAKEEGTNKQYAVKETFQDQRYKNREAGILKQVNVHPCIVTVHQMFYTNKKDGKYLNIVMDYLPTSLHHVIQNYALQNKFMPDFDVAYFAVQLIRACSFCWRLNISHRDIKPQNIVCDPSTKQLRLCDFGSAKTLNDSEWNKHYICSRFYRAPELLCQSNYYSCAVDCWSVGCVLAECYLNDPVFSGSNTREQLKLISYVLGPIPSSSYPADPKQKNSSSQLAEYKIPAAKMQKHLQKTDNKHVSLNGADFIRHLLCYVPSQRFDLSTLQCLNHEFVKTFLTPNGTDTESKYPDLEFMEGEEALINI